MPTSPRLALLRASQFNARKVCLANSRDLETSRTVAVSMGTQACYLSPVSQVSPTDPGEECVVEQLPALTLATGWSLGTFPCEETSSGQAQNWAF